MFEPEVKIIVADVLKRISSELWSGLNEPVTTLMLSDILDRVAQRLREEAGS